MKPPIDNFDFFLLRTPRLPSRVIYQLNVIKNEKDLWDYLKRIFTNEDLQDAIYLASVNLYEELIAALKGEKTITTKLLSTLFKYVTRMAGRPTPYGKFSGIALGEITNLETSLKLSDYNFSALFRMDTGLGINLIRQALETTDIEKRLVYFSNTTLHEVGDRYQYIAYSEKSGKRNFNWVRVVKNPLLTYILNSTKYGRTFTELINTLEQSGVPSELASSYISQLINAKLLISELEPIVTGRAPSYILADKLKYAKGNIDVSSTLNETQKFISKLNNDNGLASSGMGNMKLIADLEGQNLIQADLKIGMINNRINKRVIENLAKELSELLTLKSSEIPSDLKIFCRDFFNKYGDREVPLLEALDPERGIGYGTLHIKNPKNSPLLDGLGTRREIGEKSPFNSLMISTIDRYWSGCIRPAIEIELDLQEIQLQKASTELDIPASFYALGNFISSDCIALEKGDYRFNLLACGGVSSIPLMTRFCHIDERLTDKLKECVAWEDDQVEDSIFAEVVYFPENKAGNILARPPLRKYEIPIIGQSSVAEEFKILLSDLLISINAGKIILRSKRLDKEIIPRLSSAHNYHYGMAIYRFLCDLQHQSQMLDISWDWGQFSAHSFLPRVTYKHIILTRARWKISSDTFKNCKGNDNITKLAQLKEQLNLPNIVSIIEGDNELPVDLRSPMGANIVMKQLEKQDLLLYEYIFAKNESPLIDTNGEHYNNEVIIPFKFNRLRQAHTAKRTTVNLAKRYFQLGSEWVYIKIYCGMKEAEWLLKNQLPPLIAQFEKTNAIKKWFFIRYHDPDFHLRFRFLLPKNESKYEFQHIIECLNSLLEPLIENGTIHQILFDTYERELERYGENNIELCESIFHVDSENTLLLLPLFINEEGELLRWLTAAKGIDHLLTAFDLGIDGKLMLVESWRNEFLQEFSTYDKLRYKLDVKYRENRKQLEEYFNNSEHENEQTNKILKIRFKKLVRLVNLLSSEGKNMPDKYSLIFSLSHMYINRHFAFNQREHEMVIYHFLSKHYLSAEKKSVKNTPFAIA